MLVRLISQAGPQATVEVSVPAAWLGDAARVFPVTIDPHMTSGLSFSGGPSADAYVDAAFPTTAEGTYDPNTLKIGTRPVNGGSYDSKTYVSFGLGGTYGLDGSENHILSASLSLNNTYSYTCTAEPVVVAMAAGAWSPNTLTWNNQPNSVGSTVSKSFSHGYSSSCPAARESYDVTYMVQRWSNGPTGYNGGGVDNGLVVTSGVPGNNYGYKVLGAAENGAGAASTLNVSWENCTYYGTYEVCGALRDKYAAVGAPSGLLGSPTANPYYLSDGGQRSDFTGGSIFWSSATGAHYVYGAISYEYSNILGGPTSLLGYPVSDEQAAANSGRVNYFQGGAIYWSAATGAHNVQGNIYNEYRALGADTSALGLPTADEGNAVGGRQSAFVNGSIYWSSATGAHYLSSGPINDQWAAQNKETGYLGSPTSDPYAVNNHLDTRQDFSGGYIDYSTVTKAANPAANGAQLLQPVANQRTGRRLPIQVSVPTGWSAATLQYRRGGADACTRSTWALCTTTTTPSCAAPTAPRRPCLWAPTPTTATNRSSRPRTTPSTGTPACS